MRRAHFDSLHILLPSDVPEQLEEQPVEWNPDSLMGPECSVHTWRDARNMSHATWWQKVGLALPCRCHGGWHGGLPRTGRPLGLQDGAEGRQA